MYVFNELSLLPGFETNARVLGESEVLENPSFLLALVVALKSREVLESLDYDQRITSTSYKIQYFYTTGSA